MALDLIDAATMALLAQEMGCEFDGNKLVMNRFTVNVTTTIQPRFFIKKDGSLVFVTEDAVQVRNWFLSNAPEVLREPQS